MTHPKTTWHTPRKKPTLKKDEVHVWRASLEIEPQQTLSLRKILSTDETERAERFHFEKDRYNFIAARGLLRMLLGLYLSIEPNRIKFSYSPYGKPFLAEECNPQMIRFNLAHSHGFAFFAFVIGREVGIDLERIRSNLEIEQIASRYFSCRESAALLSLPSSMRLEAFFNCWTRKEAYIKARGEGLSIPLDEFDVSLAPGEKAELLGVRGNTNETARWSLHDLTPAPDYKGALVVEGRNLPIKCFEWSEKMIQDAKRDAG